MDFRKQYIEETARIADDLFRECEKELDSISSEVKSTPLRLCSRNKNFYDLLKISSNDGLSMVFIMLRRYCLGTFKFIELMLLTFPQ